MTEENDSFFPFAAGQPPKPTRSALPAWMTPAAPHPVPQCEALDLLNAGRFAEALVVIEKFLEIDPEEVNWLFLKGTCLLELGDCQAALAPLAAAERLAPFDPDVLLIKADALLELRKLDQAGQALTQLLALHPEHSRGCYRFACWAALSGRPRQALNELRCLVDEDSGFREEAARDPAFAGLHGLPAFRKLIAVPPRARNRPLRVRPRPAQAPAAPADEGL